MKISWPSKETISVICRRRNRIIIEFLFEEVGYFSDGLHVSEKGTMGFINRDGVFVIYSVRTVLPFRDGWQRFNYRDTGVLWTNSGSLWLSRNIAPCYPFLKAYLLLVRKVCGGS